MDEPVDGIVLDAVEQRRAGQPPGEECSASYPMTLNALRTVP